MNEEPITNGISQVAGHILSVLGENHNIWLPIIVAWGAGFLYAKKLKADGGRDSKGFVLRQQQKEWCVYKTNAGVAFVVYILLNLSWQVDDLLGSALLAASSAVLLPAIWFRFHKVPDHTHPRMQDEP